MKKMKRANRNFSGLLLSLAVVCVLMLSGFGDILTAHAVSGTGSLDLTKEGSITVTLRTDDNGGVVSDGILTLYQVAVLDLHDWDMSYIYTAAFEGCAEAPEYSKDPDPVKIASAMAEWASVNSVQGTARGIGLNGTATFDGLIPGLYLIVQTESSEGYYAINPFLVTLPMEENAEWVYDIDASPKTEILKEKSEGRDAEPVEKETPPAVIPPDKTPVSPISPSLPQTGQLNWPVPVLAILGTVLIAAGIILKKDRRYAS